MQRHFIPVIIMLAVGLSVWLLLRPEKTPPSQESAKTAPVAHAAPLVSAPGPADSRPPPEMSGSAPKEPPPPSPTTVTPPAQRPSPPLHPLQDAPAWLETESVARNLRHFGQRFGGNPVGTNAEIVRFLNGGNPAGVRYLSQEVLRLNAQGELLDHFGTPYFFHQMSATEMEVRSAGEDRQLWTADDIVIK